MRGYSATLIFLALYINMLNICHGYTCGYNSKCTCKKTDELDIVMDCGNTALSLCTLCEHVGNASNLRAELNHIIEVKKKCLHGCQELHELYLYKNGIRILDTDAFVGMASLRILDLSHNELDGIYRQGSNTDSKRLAPLANLEVLLINGNFNRPKSDNAQYPDMTGFQSLRTLYLDGLEDTDIGPTIGVLGNLSKLVFSGFHGSCNLGYLKNSTFQNMTSIRHLDISNCNITNINAGCFTELRQLEYLDVSTNIRLGFAVLRNISFSLQSTNIKFLNYSKMFSYFGQSNTLRRIDICYLRNTTLREIVLDNNMITQIETNALQLFPNTLQVMYIKHNWLNFGLYMFQLACLESIVELNMDYQYASRSPLLYLIEDHDIVDLEGPLDDCPFYEEAKWRNDTCSYFVSDNIRNFPLYQLPKNIKVMSMTGSSLDFELGSLHILKLSNNIVEINLSGNILYSLKGPVESFPSLKRLDLSNNYCSYVSGQFFDYATNIEYLNFGQNFLGNVLAADSKGDIFGKLSSLKTLNLSSNSITNLAEKVFRGLEQLETLLLHSNYIVEWTADISYLQSLVYLDLSRNLLSSLPKSVMEHFENEHNYAINLSGNTLKCGCDNAEFLRWLVKHKKHFVSYDEYMFIAKDTNVRLNVHEFETAVKDLSKECASYTLLIVLGSIGVAVALSIVLGGIVYKNRWKLRYFLYIAKNRFYGYKQLPNAEPLENYRYDVFVSYAEDNIRFILDGIIPQLEDKGLSLCIHQRDFLAGNAISANILDAIHSSRRTLVILSKSFVKRKWCLYEFNMARMESIYSRNGQNMLLVVMLEAVDIKDMSAEMAQWIRTESYLEYTGGEDEDLFWERLNADIRR